MPITDKMCTTQYECQLLATVSLTVHMLVLNCHIPSIGAYPLASHQRTSRCTELSLLTVMKEEQVSALNLLS